MHFGLNKITSFEVLLFVSIFTTFLVVISSQPESPDRSSRGSPSGSSRGSLRDSPNLSPKDSNGSKLSFKENLIMSNPIVTAKDLVKKGDKLMAKGKYAKAVQFYKKASNMKSNNPLYYKLTGMCHLEMENFLSAKMDFEAAILHEKTNPEKDLPPVFTDSELAELGERFFEKGRIAHANWCYTEANKRNPTNPIHLKQRGICFYLQEKLDRTLSDFQDAISIVAESKKEDIRTSLFENDFESQLVQLGEKLFDRKHFDEAFWCFNEAVKHNPRNAECFEKIGLCQRELGDLRTAIESLENAIKLEPSRKDSLSEIIENLREHLQSASHE